MTDLDLNKIVENFIDNEIRFICASGEFTVYSHDLKNISNRAGSIQDIVSLVIISENSDHIAAIARELEQNYPNFLEDYHGGLYDEENTKKIHDAVYAYIGANKL